MAENTELLIESFLERFDEEIVSRNVSLPESRPETIIFRSKNFEDLRRGNESGVFKPIYIGEFFGRRTVISMFERPPMWRKQEVRFAKFEHDSTLYDNECGFTTLSLVVDEDLEKLCTTFERCMTRIEHIGSDDPRIELALKPSLSVEIREIALEYILENMGMKDALALAQ